MDVMIALLFRAPVKRSLKKGQRFVKGSRLDAAVFEQLRLLLYNIEQMVSYVRK